MTLRGRIAVRRSARQRRNTRSEPMIHLTWNPDPHMQGDVTHATLKSVISVISPLVFARLGSRGVARLPSLYTDYFPLGTAGQEP
jgi:hypothetical protein